MRRCLIDSLMRSGNRMYASVVSSAYGFYYLASGDIFPGAMSHLSRKILKCLGVAQPPAFENVRVPHGHLTRPTCEGRPDLICLLVMLRDSEEFRVYRAPTFAIRWSTFAIRSNALLIRLYSRRFQG